MSNKVFMIEEEEEEESSLHDSKEETRRRAPIVDEPKPYTMHSRLEGAIERESI